MNFYIHPDAHTVAEAGADLFADEAERALRSEGRFTVALAGGSTPRLLYETLAARGAAIDWSRTHVFWGDERCVPLDHPESNSKMAQDALLSKVEIPALNVHRMRGELVPHEGAREYDALLRNFFGGYQSRKTFDLILLGMGEDGHTASLFPEAGVLEEASRWSAAVQAPAGVSPRDRITLTLPPIVASARCVFLVTGERKRSIVTAIRKDPASAASIYPAARVAFFRESTWLIDEKAAGTARG